MKAQYRPEIDGLRALAVVGVILYHLGLTIDDQRLLKGGYVGVDVFFVISGYLIASRIVSLQATGAPWVREFLDGRVRRIVPAQLLMLMLSFGLFFAIMNPGDFLKLSVDALAALTFTSNMLFYLKDPYEVARNDFNALVHTWSLGVEMQFYLVIAAMLFFIRTRFRQAALAVVAGASLISLYAAEVLTAYDKYASFYLLPTRFWELGAGVMLALVRPPGGLDERAGPAMVWLGLALVVGSMLTFDAATHHPGFITVLPVLGTAAILRYGRSDAGAGRLLSIRYVAGIGLISYSLYLWHQPILVGLRYVYAGNVPVALKLFAVVATFALAWLSWRYVEEPFRRKRPVAPFGRTSSPVVFGTVTVVALVAWGSAATGAFQSAGMHTHPLVYEPRRGVAYVDGKPCKINIVDGACVIGDHAIKPTWALVGDSHAETLAGPVGDMLARHKRSAYLYVLAGCPFIEGVLGLTFIRDCVTFSDAVLKALLRDGIEAVIINDYRNAYLTGLDGTGAGSFEMNAVYDVAKGKGAATREADVLRLQTATIDKLVDAGIRVFFIATVPDGPVNVPQAVSQGIRSGELPVAFELPGYLARSQVLFDALRRHERNPLFTALYPHRVLCDETRCRTHSDTRLHYTDTNHLSEDGARLLIKAFEPVIFRTESTQRAN